MTETLRIEHTFPCTEETFWGLFLSTEYNHALFKDYLRFPVWRVGSQRTEGTVIHRVIEVEPHLGDLPGPIKKVIGDNFGYKEDGAYDVAARRYKVRVVPNRLSDKILVNAEQSTEPGPGGTCRRIFRATIDVKIFGIGNLIEKKIAADTTHAYEVGADFTTRYLHQHDLAIKP
jgi:Protein of unknown function (DUF2505)